ncbi:uncharacterized protein LOC110036455 [Phalaenopsis equestris]|uniref:uncharacterized protein LOC110036455 n=1 Tax=Phalaenopsis equestris TaxID=78828 RepID=UPI0009E5CBF1|nr:uncharacterized protein LOC110036455 [Phalaenopsis equestris]
MGTVAETSRLKEREGAEIVRGAEACYENSMALLEELGFPRGVMPLKNLEECGRVRATGFVWMKQKAPYEHFFKNTNTRVSYAQEVTAYIEKGKMKKMSGVKSKQMLIWVPLVEMSRSEDGKRIYFKSNVGIGRSYPASAFEEEEEDKESK